MDGHCKDSELMENAGIGKLLRASDGSEQDHLVSILNNSKDVLYKYSFTDQRYHYVSQSTELLDGYPFKEVIEKGAGFFLERIHPDDKPAMLKVFSQFSNSSIPDSKLTLTYRLRHKDGHYLWLKDEISIIRDENQKITAIVGIVRDITEQKNLQFEFELSEMRFSAIFENAVEGILIADIEKQTFVYANPAIAEMLGYSLEDLLKLGVADIHPKESLKEVCANFEQMAGGEKKTVEFPCLKKDGSQIYVQITGTCIGFDGSRYAVGFFTDITERKHLLSELKDSEDRFKRLSEASFEAITVHKEGKILDVNSQFLSMFGYTREEALAIDGVNLIAPSHRKAVSDRIAAGTNEAAERFYEAEGLRKDGSVFPMEVRVRSSTIDGQPVRIGAIRDVTKRKRLEEQLAESERKYRDLYTHARVALYRNRIVDSRLLECNEAFALQLGYASREQCLAECEYTINHYADRVQREEFLELLRRDGAVYDYQTELVRRDGAHIWVAVTVKMYPEKEYLDGAHVDITASKVLTKAEKKVLDLILQGRSNKEIARHFRRSIRTIEDHRSHIMQKLHVSNLVELVQKTQFFVPDTKN